MIDAHFGELEAVTSTSAACGLLGVSRATRYRRQRPPVHGPPLPRPAPPSKLTEAERQRVLTVLRSDEYCDLAPAQVWARLLDDGIYLWSWDIERHEALSNRAVMKGHRHAPVAAGASKLRAA